MLHVLTNLFILKLLLKKLMGGIYPPNFSRQTSPVYARKIFCVRIRPHSDNEKTCCGPSQSYGCTYVINTIHCPPMSIIYTTCIDVILVKIQKRLIQNGDGRFHELTTTRLYDQTMIDRHELRSEAVMLYRLTDWRTHANDTRTHGRNLIRTTDVRA